MPNFSGETLAAPTSCSTHAVTDCHFFMNASASAPDMFISTLPRSFISVSNCGLSAAVLNALTSVALTSSGVSRLTNTP